MYETCKNELQRYYNEENFVILYLDTDSFITFGTLKTKPIHDDLRELQEKYKLVFAKKRNPEVFAQNNENIHSELKPSSKNFRWTFCNKSKRTCKQI